MKKLLMVLFVFMTSFSLSAFENDTLLECTLENGEKLIALDYMLIKGDEILVKDAPKHQMSPNADWYQYRSWAYEADVYIQYCARGGNAGIQLLNIETDEKLELRCLEDFSCY